jgi:8-oxo-dGTP pyrophosphatase MutT (NUDIX family)
MKKWLTLSTQKVLTAHVFRYLKVQRKSQDTGAEGEFDIVQCLNWANVVAITPDKKIVLVKQYRHGTDELTLELPGGAVHIGEDSLLAAQRELVEETGFTAKEWKLIGEVDANPAFMINNCKTYLALDAVKTHSQNLDPLEEIEVVLKNVDDIKPMIKTREITHSLIIAALFFFELEQM